MPPGVDASSRGGSSCRGSGDALNAKYQSVMRVVDEGSDVSWGSRGSRESHPLVTMMVALQSVSSDIP